MPKEHQYFDPIDDEPEPKIRAHREESNKPLYNPERLAKSDRELWGSPHRLPGATVEEADPITFEPMTEVTTLTGEPLILPYCAPIVETTAIAVFRAAVVTLGFAAAGVLAVFLLHWMSVLINSFLAYLALAGFLAFSCYIIERINPNLGEAERLGKRSYEALFLLLTAPLITSPWFGACVVGGCIVPLAYAWTTRIMLSEFARLIHVRRRPELLELCNGVLQERAPHEIKQAVAYVAPVRDLKRIASWDPGTCPYVKRIRDIQHDFDDRQVSIAGLWICCGVVGWFTPYLTISLFTPAPGVAAAYATFIAHLLYIVLLIRRIVQTVREHLDVDFSANATLFRQWYSYDAVGLGVFRMKYSRYQRLCYFAALSFAVALSVAIPSKFLCFDFGASDAQVKEFLMFILICPVLSAVSVALTLYAIMSPTVTAISELISPHDASDFGRAPWDDLEPA